MFVLFLTCNGSHLKKNATIKSEYNYTVANRNFSEHFPPVS